MGTRHPSHKSKDRTWRRPAGACAPRLAAAPLADEPFDASLPPPEAGPARRAWPLKTSDTLRPGERGTKRLVAELGARLVCVRYRCDLANRKRYKTVELIVAEAEWDPPPGPDDLVQVRVAFAEEDLRQRGKAAGGRWRPETKTWELPLRAVEELELSARIVAG